MRRRINDPKISMARLILSGEDTLYAIYLRGLNNLGRSAQSSQYCDDSELTYSTDLGCGKYTERRKATNPYTNSKPIVSPYISDSRPIIASQFSQSTNSTVTVCGQWDLKQHRSSLLFSKRQPQPYMFAVKLFISSSWLGVCRKQT